MCAILSFKSIEHKHDLWRGKDLIKKKKKLLTNEQLKSYQNAKICYICKERFKDKHAKDQNNSKVRDHCHYTGEYRSAAHSVYNLNMVYLLYFHEILLFFHNRSNYDYHFIIKELAEEFEKQFTCLWEISWPCQFQ